MAEVSHSFDFYSFGSATIIVSRPRSQTKGSSTPDPRDTGQEIEA